MRSSSALFRTLIALRYRLLWAQARTRKGKIFIFLALYAIGGLLALLLALGGIGAGVVAVRTGQAEAAARAVLTSVLVGGVFTSLVLGTGPRAAFSDRVLRRYPMSGTQRFAARHFIGILDPTWLFFSVLTLGMVAGFVMLGACPVWLGIVVALLFTAVAYLVAALVLTIVDRIMQFKRGETILTFVMMAFFTGIGLLPTLMQGKALGWWLLLDSYLIYTPAGTTAVAFAPNSVAVRALAVLVLVGWGVALFFAVLMLENWAIAPRLQEQGTIPWDSAYERLAHFICPAQSAITAKALRYCLRCKRVKYQLVQIVPMVLFFELVFGRHSHHAKGISSLGYFFFAGAFATFAMVINQFGYDGAGIRRYLLLPANPSSALQAHSRASMFLGMCALIPAILLWCALEFRSIDGRTILFVVFDGFGGLFLFHAAGLWSTVLSPRRAEFNQVMGNDMSMGGNIILFFGIFAMFATIGPLLAAGMTLRAVTAHWWVPALVLVISAPAYLLSLRFAGRILESRREQFVETIAGATAN